jgi:hypothetical protein
LTEIFSSGGGGGGGGGEGGEMDVDADDKMVTPAPVRENLDMK